MPTLKTIKIKEMERLITKTKFQNEGEFYNYAKRNLKALISGYLPKNRLKLISNRKNVYERRYERRDEFDCLIYYRCASISKRIKKVPFFVYWLNLKKQDFLTRSKIENLLNKDEVFLVNRDTWEIINKLKEDQNLTPEIQKRLEKTYNSNVEEITCKNRISYRYQKREINQDMILSMVKEGLFNKIKTEILEYINRRSITTWRDLRRSKRSLQKIDPEILRWFLEELEEEGRISINIYSKGNVFLRSL